MALTVEELQVLITANGNQFKGEMLAIKKELQSLNQTTNTTGNSITGNLFGSLLKANVISNVITSTVSNLTGGFKDFVGQVVSSGSALSRLRIANSAVTANLGMTSDQVRQLRDDLADANTYGIVAENIISSLALSGMVKYAESLRYVDARSGETKQGVTALTLAIKDLSASRGIDSDLGIERITKFIQRGEATFADGLIEIGNLNDEYQAYGDTLGKTAGELTAQEKVQVRLNIAMREGAKSFGAYASTYNSSGKIMSSTGMLLKSIVADLGANLEPILRVGSLAFLEFFRGIQGSLSSATNVIAEFANKVAGYMVAVIRIIGKLGQNLPFLGNAFSRLANFTLQPIKAEGKLEDSINGSGDAMDATGKKADDLSKKLGDLAGFDKMNILQKPTEAETVSSGGITGGGTIAEGLAGITDSTKEIMSYANSVEKIFSDLGEKITGIFNTIGYTITKIFDLSGISEGLKLIIPNVISIFNNYKDLFGQMFIDIWQISQEYAPILMATFSNLFNSILTESFLPGVELLTRIWADWSNSLKTTWDSTGKSLVEGIANAINNIALIFQGVWDKVLYPIIKPFLEVLQRLWEDTFKGVVDSVIKFVAKLVDTAMVIFNNFISPIIMFLQKQMAPAWEFLGNLISSIFQVVVSVIGSSVSGIVNFLSGILDFIKGVFTGNWQLAWSGIVNAFSGIFGTVVGIFKGIFNGIVDFINRFISQINGFIQNIPDAVFQAFGRNKSDIRIGTIPRLAGGGVISSPTLAVMGESNYQEAVLPLDRNTEWAEKVADLINKNTSGESGATVIVKIGEDTVFEKFVDYANNRALISNRPLLNI
jgi:hypothetical protein